MSIIFKEEQKWQIFNSLLFYITLFTPSLPDIYNKAMAF